MKLDKELKAVGKKAQFSILNHHAYKSSVSNQTKRCDFPVFQDSAAVSAWTAMKGGKQYWYVYNKAGELHAWYLPWGANSLNIIGGPASADYKKLRAVLESLQ